MANCEHGYPIGACPRCLSRTAAFHQSLYFLSDEELRLARREIEKRIKEREEQNGV